VGALLDVHDHLGGEILGQLEVLVLLLLIRKLFLLGGPLPFPLLLVLTMTRMRGWRND
jgi:hypothetical protein